MRIIHAIKYSGLMVISSLTLMSCGPGTSGNYDGNGATPTQQQQEQADGKQSLRYETFGNEGFWTDAARLTAGIVKAKITPVQALKIGLSVNTEVLDAATLAAVGNEIKTLGTNGPLLNSFDTTVKLLNANAVIGVVVRDTNGDGKLDVASGDKVGVSCVLCHAITDKSAFDLPTGGSIGKEVDGPAAHTINIGKILALADNTKAFFPNAQLKGADGKSIGRVSSSGLTKDSTEAEFDAFFSNPSNYPVGTFDDTVDGNGNSMHNSALFRQDLAAPFGSAGELEKFDQFANTVYTVLFDPTNLTTPGGRAFLKTAAGAVGTKLADDYEQILKDTGVKGYPYVKGSTIGTPGSEDALIGIRVDEATLQSQVAYVNSLRSPSGVIRDAAAVARGKVHFQSAQYSCTTCHNADNSLPVSTQVSVIPMKTVFPGDAPVVLVQRDAPVTGPVENTPGSTFDDKMIVINATLRGGIRGVALPLLMDLSRKPNFLHDNSVATFDMLFNSSRGATAPHPFYVNSSDRSDLIEYLKSLDDTSR